MHFLFSSILVVCVRATTETNQTFTSQTTVRTTTSRILALTSETIAEKITKSPPVITNQTVNVPANASMLCRITSSNATIAIIKDNTVYSSVQIENNSFRYSNNKIIASGSIISGVINLFIQIPVETLDDQGLYVCHVTYPDKTIDIDNSLNLTVFGRLVHTL